MNILVAAPTQVREFRLRQTPYRALFSARQAYSSWRPRNLTPLDSARVVGVQAALACGTSFWRLRRKVILSPNIVHDQDIDFKAVFDKARYAADRAQASLAISI